MFRNKQNRNIRKLLCRARKWLPDFAVAALILLGSSVCVTALASERPPQLTATKWQLQSFQSMDDAIGTIRPADPALYNMQLNRDGSVNMHLNCNHAMGQWSAVPAADQRSGNFTFGQLAATKAFCPPPSLDEKILADSQYVRTYLLRDGKLHLSLLADAGIYTWAPISDKNSPTVMFTAAENGGPRNWRVKVESYLNLREQPSTRARVLSRYPADTLLDNLGCRMKEERRWCDVQQLGGSPRGFVAAEYLTPAISPDGNVATGADDSALRAGQQDYDATGHLPCAQALGQPMTECSFAVSRAGGGYATVVIPRPDGRSRAIFFRSGIPIGADASQADGYPEFSAGKESDLHLIRIGDERYEIPDAVIFGG